MKRLVSILTLALISGAANAQERIGSWSTEFNQGILAYNLAGRNSNKDLVTIQCAPSGASVGFYLNDKPTKLNHELSVTIDRSTFKLFNTDGDLVATDTSVGAAAFKDFWRKLRAGHHMTVRFDDGRSGVFDLRGSARMLPRKACKTEF